MSLAPILVTGFGAFPGVDKNPSLLIARQLEAAPPPGFKVIAAELPVTFAGVPQALEGFVLGSPRPAGILAIGVHGGAGFRLEQCAVAGPTAGKPDNDGATGEGLRADCALQTDLDLDHLCGELAELAAGECGGVRVSIDAGGYVCDWTYLHVLQHAQGLGVPGLFLHVPPLHVAGVDQQMPFVRELVARLGLTR